MILSLRNSRTVRYRY